MQNGYTDENGVQQTVFPGYPADATVIGNAWSMQVVNGDTQPLAGNFAVTENTWTSTNSTGGFIDNIFVAFSNVGFGGFQSLQKFTINGVPANSFNQFYLYGVPPNSPYVSNTGLQFANPSPTGP